MMQSVNLLGAVALVALTFSVSVPSAHAQTLKVYPPAATINVDTTVVFTASALDQYRAYLRSGSGTVNVKGNRIYFQADKPQNAILRIESINRYLWTNVVIEVVGPLAVSPNPAYVAVGGQLPLSVSGGASPFTFVASAGTVSNQIYFAPASPGNVTVTVQDRIGNILVAPIQVYRPLTVTAQHRAQAGAQFSVGAANGAAPLSYSVIGSGTVTQSGIYTAPSRDNVADTVRVQDAAGNVKFSDITIKNNLVWSEINGVPVKWDSRRGFFYDGRDDSREWVCGGLANTWEREATGFYVVGGSYTSWQRNPDGTYVVGGKYNSWQRNPDGTYVLGGYYDSWWRNPDGRYVVGGRYDSWWHNFDGTWELGGLYDSWWTDRDNYKRVGAQYDSWWSQPNGHYVVGGLYDSWWRNSDGTYSLGGAYDSWFTNIDGTYVLGGLYTSYKTNPNGTKVCGLMYDGWQRGSDGKVCVGGRYSGCVRNLLSASADDKIEWGTPDKELDDLENQGRGNFRPYEEKPYEWKDEELELQRRPRKPKHDLVERGLSQGR